MGQSSHVKKDRYIGGQWVAAESAEVIDVIDASTEGVYGTVPAGTASEVDKAVKAAREAFAGWSQAPPDKRRTYLEAIAAGLEARADEIAELISHELGAPAAFSKQVQAGLPVMHFK